LGAVRRFGRYLEAERLEDLCRRAEVRHKVREMVKVEFARGRALAFGDVHVALI
jgi:hypothetical protein